MKVSNMQSSKGNDVPNQFIVQGEDDCVFFQSYETVIAKLDRKTDKFYLDENKWNYSKTTSKYRNIFTCLTTAETGAKIKSGEIQLVDLNK